MLVRRSAMNALRALKIQKQARDNVQHVWETETGRQLIFLVSGSNIV